GLAQLADFEQVPHEQRIRGERGDERALLIGETGAVGVAIDRESDVGALLWDPREELVDVRRDRLGVHAAEVRVALRMQLDDARLPAAEQTREVAARAAKERLAHDRVAGGAERVEVEELRDACEVVGRGVEDLDETLRLRVIELHAFDVAGSRFERADDRLELRDERG